MKDPQITCLMDSSCRRGETRGFKFVGLYKQKGNEREKSDRAFPSTYVMPRSLEFHRFYVLVTPRSRRRHASRLGHEQDGRKSKRPVPVSSRQNLCG